MQHIITISGWLDEPLAFLQKTVSYPLHALAEALDKRRKLRATYNELNQLTDRELRDIGIGRSQIMQVARDFAYGEDKDA